MVSNLMNCFDDDLPFVMCAVTFKVRYVVCKNVQVDVQCHVVTSRPPAIDMK